VSFYAELKRRNVLRVAVAYLAGAWLLIQILETLFPIFGLAETSIRVVVIFLAIGFMPVLVLAWVFEWTPEGFKRDPGASTGVAPASKRTLDRIITVVLVLALGYFAVDKFVLDPARDARQEQAAEQRGRTEAFVESYGDKSIAVLPFADLSADGDQAYFSDGIAEEILNLLAKVRELRVISRSSAFQYRGEGIHIPTVAEELNVAYVLEGSVRKAGDTIRITAQLIDARADAHLWSENYDREFSDVFYIQDDIAQSIVEQLQITLLGEGPKAARTDPETYALYLQAHHAYWILQDASTVTEELLEEVLVRDPEYVPALNLMVQVVFDATGNRPGSKYTLEEGIALMQGYVDRVLAIDPNNSEALAHRGWMAFFYRNDLETTALYLNRALENDPVDVWALLVSAVINRRIGKNEEAITFAKAALSRDPLCSHCLYVLMQASFRAGYLDQAQAASERRMRVVPGGWFGLGNIYLFKGEIQRALECYDKQKDDHIAWLTSRAIAFYEMGDVAAHLEALSELQQIDESSAFLGVAKVLAWVGDADGAFKWLDRYLDPEATDYSEVVGRTVWSPFFRRIHDDPRWLQLLENAGFGPDRLASIEIDLPDIYRSK